MPIMNESSSAGARNGQRQAHESSQETECKLVFSRSRITNYRTLAGKLSVSAADRDALEAAVISAAYKRWGADFGSRLYGRFAAVIRDEEKDELILVRDHFGLEPLYYAEYNGELFYSDSLRALLRACPLPPVLNESALSSYFLYGYLTGSDTFFRGVRKLMPGHTLVWSCRERRFVSDMRWFAPTFEKDDSVSERGWLYILGGVIKSIFRDEQEDIAEFDPVCLLSSGVDSACLLAASGIRRAMGIGFRETEHSEAQEAEETATALDRSFSAAVVSREDFFAAFQKVMGTIDQPIINPSIPVIYSALEKNAGETALFYSGEGIDEFFGGYFHPYVRTPLRIDRERPYLGFGQFMPENTVKKLLKTECCGPICALHEEIFADTESSGTLSSYLRTDISLFLEGDTCAYIAYLRRTLGLDIRQPFADPRLFEAASQIPDELLLHTVEANGSRLCIGKYIFRENALRYLPLGAAFRAKKPFITPVRRWMEDPTARVAFEQLLFSECSAAFFRQDFLKELWERYVSGESGLWKCVYAIGAFVCWYESIFEDGETR